MNISLPQITYYTALHLSSLFIIIIGLTDGDLSAFSTTYLGKTCGTSLLLFIGTSLLVGEAKALSRLKNWHYALVITSISNLIFLPLLRLISQQENLSLWLPVWLMGCFMSLWVVALLLKGLGQWLWTFHHRPTPASALILGGELAPFLEGKTILLHGATSALGQAWLTLAAALPKKILLFDKDLIQLELIEIRLKKACPQLEIHSFSSPALTSKTVQSIFKSYKPDFIFDFDRYFCVPQADGGLAAFLKTNFLIPYWLASNAHQVHTTLMISLQPELIQPEASLLQSQKILTSALQRLDSSQLRVINIQAPLLIEDSALPWYLEKLQQGGGKQTLLTHSLKLLTDLLTLSQQLMSNPAHHGALWSSLFAKKLSLSKLKTILKEMPGQQIEQLQQIPETKQSLKTMVQTSHPRLAILSEELVLTPDIEAYFLRLETILQKNPSQIEAFLQAD